MNRVGLALIVFLVIPTVALAQSSATSSPMAEDWLSSLDTYAKVFGGVLTGLGTLFGLPVVILNFKKTQAEIKKLELEAASLENSASTLGNLESGISVKIHKSEHVNVQVLADPRFLGPLLLLLDFIFAWIFLTLAGHFFNLLGLQGVVRVYLLGLLSAALLIPIAREARRVRSVLRPKGIQVESDA